MFSWRSGISIGQPLPIEALERNSSVEFRSGTYAAVTGPWDRHSQLINAAGVANVSLQEAPVPRVVLDQIS
jgi:hypothetical protein